MMKTGASRARRASEVLDIDKKIQAPASLEKNLLQWLEEYRMPKRVGYLYEKALDKEYLKTIIYRAAEGRHNRRDIKAVLDDIDNKVEELYTMLKEDTYKPNPVKVRVIYDASSQKTREIKMISFFPDALIQWIIVDLLEKPVLMRGMDPGCSSSIPGRGGKNVYKRITKQIGRDPKGSKYAVQMDIRHYYQNINISLLMSMLKRRCKDIKLLALTERILRATSEDGEIGLAIGFYLNQWLANFFLEGLDRFIRGHKEVKCYVRYMDNITFIGTNKRKLRKIMNAVIDFAAAMGLEIKKDYQLFPLKARAVQAVGYRYFKDGHVLLRKRNWLKLRRQILRVTRKQKAKEFIPKRMARGLLSRLGAQKKFAPSRKVRDMVNEINLNAIRRIAA